MAALVGGGHHPFTVLTDHRNLEYLKTARRLNPRQARWSLFFTRFDFKVTYRPGTKNVKADALYRQFTENSEPNPPENIIPPTVVIAPIQWDIITEIEQANSDQDIPPDCPENRLFVPETLRNKTIALVHTALSSGHPGINATLQLLQNRFWWPTLRKDTISHINRCQVCNTQKPSRHLPAGLLHPLPIPERPWSHIAIDFITDLPNSDGHSTILTVGGSIFESLAASSHCPNCLRLWRPLNSCVTRYFVTMACPKTSWLDRGPQFTSRLWSAFFKALENQRESHLRVPSSI